MSQKLLIMFGFIMLFLFYNPAMSQNTWTWSVDSTTLFFGDTCFVTNIYQGTSLFMTHFYKLENDTIYFIGSQEPGGSIHQYQYNNCLLPLYLSIGSGWWGHYNGNPAFFYVQDYLVITVPAGNFPSYIINITDSISGNFTGCLTCSENVGTVSMLNTFQGDTIALVLNDYSIIGGVGCYPISIGNIWYYEEGFYTGINDNEQNPNLLTTFSLDQNYPNPFNSETNFSFSLNRPTNISLFIYDIRGVEISCLVDDYLPAGIYQKAFDASGLSTGIYFACLKSEGLSQTKKLILIK